MSKKRDIIEVYREPSGISHLLLFENTITKYKASDYLKQNPKKGVYLPCETLSYDKGYIEQIKNMNEYVGELVIEYKFSHDKKTASFVDFILVLIANPSFRLEEYMEKIIDELSGNNYAVQSIPTIKLSYMGVEGKDNHLFE